MIDHVVVKEEVMKRVKDVKVIPDKESHIAGFLLKDQVKEITASSNSDDDRSKHNLLVVANLCGISK